MVFTRPPHRSRSEETRAAEGARRPYRDAYDAGRDNQAGGGGAPQLARALASRRTGAA